MLLLENKAYFSFTFSVSEKSFLFLINQNNMVDKETLIFRDKVILGEYDTRNETDCIYTRYGSDCADPPQTFNIEEIIPHESFRFNSTLHDIALIRLDKDIKFSSTY